MERVIVLVDGFNTYYGLRSRFDRRYLWLDLQALSASLLKDGQELRRVVYFTARVRNSVESVERQSVYLDALVAHCPKLEIVSGRFQPKRHVCRTCGACRTGYEEKETDVNIAVALLERGVRDEFDTALLMSADSDLCPAIDALHRLCPAKRLIAAFPPGRTSAAVRSAADGAFQVGQAKIRQAQLPEAVMSPHGVTLKRPACWC